MPASSPAPIAFPSPSENCARIKELGYIAGKHMDLYGEHIELVSDPFDEGDCIAVHARSANNPTIRTIELPVTILAGWEDLFKEPVDPTASSVPSKTPLPGAQPRLLLVEPQLDLLAARALLLTQANYSVTPISGQEEILELPREESFLLAVLNDTLGQPVLRSVAQSVRRIWPPTRILILRNGTSALEDQLYDEAIDGPFNPTALLAALLKLTSHP